MQSVLGQLGAWRRRERFIRVAWGAARLFAVALVALAAACLIDYAVDRSRDTPMGLRVAMTAGQLLLAGWAAWRFLGRLGVPSLDRLAAMAESRLPAVGHRLVTALQLNRAGANTEGISGPMLAEVTREAEGAVKRERLSRFADPRRLWHAAYLLVPVVLAWGGFAAWKPELVATLVQRQALLNVEIARPVKLVNETAELWAAGDAVTVRIRVEGPVGDDAVGELRILPEGQPAEELPLTFAGRTEEGHATFTATLPPMSAPFAFRAWLGGGRLKTPGAVRFESRPTVQSLEAAVILPKYVDPEGKREYRRFQPQAEVYALPDSEVEVKAAFSKPLQRGEVVLYGPGNEASGGRDIELGRVPMALDAARTGGTARFALPGRPTGYRVEAVDDFEFKNVTPPYRGVTVAPDRPPQVGLLPESLKDPKEEGPLEDFLVDGMPLRLGGQVQVGYTAKSPLGVARAYLVYRVNDGPWTPLPLTPVVADAAKVGRFVPELGVFTESGPFGQVEFYPLPARNPEEEPNGLAAGGRYNFKTSSLKKRVPAGSGTKDAEIEVGDTVEIRVAAYDRKPGPSQPPSVPPAAFVSGEAQAAAVADVRRAAGWSPESRIKQVVSEAKFQAWREEHYRTRVKLGELEQKQRAVFQPAGGG